MIDPYHAFILGKTFGTTNLIALGPQSQTVANQQITVLNRGGGVVTLNKGAAQFSYTCTTVHCEASPLPGDQTQFFNDVNGSVQRASGPGRQIRQRRGGSALQAPFSTKHRHHPVALLARSG